MIRILLCLAAASLGAIAQDNVIVFTRIPAEGSPTLDRGIWSMSLDGSGAKQLTNDGASHHPAWSPDGRRILFIRDVEKRPLELWLMDADGKNARLLRRFDSVIYSAAWAPDGKQIAVSWRSESSPQRVVTAAGRIEPGLFLLDVSGQGEPRHVVSAAFQPAWSPDGRRLAFSMARPAGQWEIHVVNTDGSGDIRLIGPEGTPGSPAWSPDGKQIAFSQFVDTRRQQIFVTNTDGSNVRQLTDDPKWSCTQPSWSPAGDRIVFGARSADQPCGGVSSTGHIQPTCVYRIFVVDVAAPNRVRQVGENGGMTPSFRPRDNRTSGARLGK